jgi:hypothetical protein
MGNEMTRQDTPRLTVLRPTHTSGYSHDAVTCSAHSATRTGVVALENPVAGAPYGEDPREVAVDLQREVASTMALYGALYALFTQLYAILASDEEAYLTRTAFRALCASAIAPSVPAGECAWHAHRLARAILTAYRRVVDIGRGEQYRVDVLFALLDDL